ncbi:uncharacterized protein EI90DRAFT_3039954 [Cantharellus anzutake]|uniref:uncharacterized protein n=1 Tax=Cantharellus anzutake TaxID=1750568 RepID=UPI0019036EC1|nr:uncharacterized protein EI90DRAFT_3039954 [Cantharellus anzutake]KAF8338984.1 hypothetical protein EI90DRAFT_3039954 [Cantharellus anzutake]
MFQYHKAFPWFNEKYNPSLPFVNLRRRVRREGWSGRIGKFIRELEEGKHDPALEPNKDDEKVIDSLTANPSNGDMEMPSAEEAKGDEAAEAADEDLPIAESAIEPNGNGKRAESPPGGGKTRDEEISVMPEGNQVLIRTIPPDIGRVKIEKACRDIPGFLHLGLGDTMQKKNYYRAGWIRFMDETEMSSTVEKLSEAKIEGFKLHVTHSTRPFRSRARRTPESASEPERIEKDLANVKKLAAVLEDEAYHLQTLPEKLPEPRNLKQSNGGELPDDSDAVITGDAEPAADSEMTVEPTREPKDRGTEALNKRLEKLLSDLNEKHKDEGSSEGTLRVKKNMIELDLYLAYLRMAFNCCYYCSAITDHEEELQRQCIKHIRTPKRSSEPAKDDRWSENLDQRTALLIDRDNADPRDYGGKLYDEELTKAVEPHVKQEDEGNSGAMSFVQKHVSGKHPELVQQLEEIPFFNNFALDPRRIAPFSHPPPPSGAGQQAPGEAYGLRSRPSETRGRSNSGGYGSYPPQYGGYYPGWPDYYGRYYDPYPPARGYGYDSGARGRSRSPPPFSGPASRKLSDRLGDFAPSPGSARGGPPPPIEGLPAKPVSSAKLEPGPHSKRRRGGSVSVDILTGGPPPPNAKEDPRAAAGRKVSYYDIDKMAEGDVELLY